MAEEWQLDGADHLLDPFVGSGTTAVSARKLGIPCTGYDLSPLAEFVSATKCAPPSRRDAELARDRVCADTRAPNLASSPRFVDPYLRRAFGDARLAGLLALAHRIRHNDLSRSCQSFLMLGLLHIVPRFAFAERNGGWLRWRSDADPATAIETGFASQISKMLGDLADDDPPGAAPTIGVADARALPDPDGSVSAVLTSPPYPNRHDYTRIFLLELLLFFLDGEQARSLRRQSFESHPEARPERPDDVRYRPPSSLQGVLRELRSSRIRRMLSGYFLDLHLCLREIGRVLRPGSPAALLVGNTQYEGHTVLVDELTAEIGEDVGLVCTEIRALRLRGNSAQQMGRYGRRPSRESIVLFRQGAN